MTELQAAKSSLQSKLIAEKDKVRSIKAEKEAVEEILNNERSLVTSLRSETAQLKVLKDDISAGKFIFCVYSCS